MNFEELDIVVLDKDLNNFNLKKGDIGTIVMCHKDKVAYEVEFVTFRGDTIAIVTIKADYLRAVSKREIPHVRLLQTA